MTIGKIVIYFLSFGNQWRTTVNNVLFLKILLQLDETRVDMALYYLVNIYYILDSELNPSSLVDTTHTLSLHVVLQFCNQMNPAHEKPREEFLDFESVEPFHQALSAQGKSPEYPVEVDTQVPTLQQHDAVHEADARTRPHAALLDEQDDGNGHLALQFDGPVVGNSVREQVSHIK